MNRDIISFKLDLGKENRSDNIDDYIIYYDNENIDFASNSTSTLEDAKNIVTKQLEILMNRKVSKIFWTGVKVKIG